MRPVLALELSTDGITLHELSYDGKWRRLAYSALTDPFLPKKMAAMRATARAAQGRFFRSQLWIPPEQVLTVEIPVSATDPDAREAEAARTLAEHPDVPGGSYVIRVGENNGFGKAVVAMVEESVLSEAKRFARGYGFGTDDITSASHINGFAQQPYFGDSGDEEPRRSVDLRKVGYFVSVATLTAAVGLAGYWVFTKIDFSRDPSTAIKATEERVLSANEDPRAPIRPTGLNNLTPSVAPNAVSAGDGLSPVPAVDQPATVFDTQIGQTSLGSDLETGAAPAAIARQSGPDLPQSPPTPPVRPATDSLPAPETTGFPMMSTSLTPLADTSRPSRFTGRRITPFNPAAAGLRNVAKPVRTDTLPAEKTTVSQSIQLAKLDDSMGLTQVRANNAAELRQARIAAAQRVPPVVVTGRPTPLPLLRGGVAIPAPRPKPVVPDAATISALQNLPARVINGRPPTLPILRGGRAIAASKQTTVTPPTAVTVTVGGADVPQNPLRPLARPDSVVVIATQNDPALSRAAVVRAAPPLHRAAGFTAKAETLAAKIAEIARTAPKYTAAPRTVRLPTNANVAREATITDGINLNDTSLIGVYGKPGAYRALIRRRGGKYTMVKIGDTLDRWKVVAITDSTVRLQKGSRTEVLRLPT